MKFDKDFNLDAFLDALEHAAVEEVVFNSNPDWSYRKTTKKVVKTITTTTSELIEDDQLVKDLVDFCKDRYCWCCRDVREKDVRGLLKRKYHILNLSKYAEPGSDYRFVMDYPDIYNYRYEGDYVDHNGWELDFWIKFEKEDYRTITMRGTGITFDVLLEIQ